MRAYILALCVVLAAAQSNQTYDNCQWAAIRPLSTTVTFAGAAAGRTIFIGNLPASRNLDVLCLNAFRNASNGCNAVTYTVNVVYADGSYPVTTVPTRLRGNGGFNVAWSANLVLGPVPATCSGRFTVTIGAVPSNPIMNPIQPNRATGVMRVDKSVSARSGEYRYVHLGQALQVQLLSLSVFSQPLNPIQLTKCSATPPYTLELVSGPNCVYSNSLEPCCQLTDADSCAAGPSCLWSKDEEHCFRVDDTLDVLPLATGLDNPTTFIARRPTTRGSSYRTSNQIRWGLRYRQAEPNCNALVDISATFSPSGGVCEEALVRDCAAATPMCLLTGNAESQEGSRYCQCLAQQERCYRSAGCSRTLFYDALTTDCSKNGCGAQCNGARGLLSFASMAFLAVVVFIIALLL